jgi:MscS family membrane protein
MPFENIPLINQIPTDVRLTLAQFLITVLIFVVLWLVRTSVVKLLLLPLERLIPDEKKKLHDIVSEALRSISSYLVIAVALFVSTLFVGVDQPAARFLSRMASTFIILAIAKFVWLLTDYLLVNDDQLEDLLGLHMENALLPLARTSTRILIIVLAGLLIAQTWQLNISAVAATIGLGGLALSLAAKDVLDDFVGFAAIIGDDIFRNNEYIISPYAEGIVEQVGMRSTRVRQLNQGIVTVPNGKIADDWVVNWSRLDKRWFNFHLNITYDTPPAKLEDLTNRIYEMFQAEEHVVDKDNALVSFEEYQDYSLAILVRCWHKIDDYNEAKRYRQHINIRLMHLLDELDIRIAFPTQSLRIQETGIFDGNGSPVQTNRRERQKSFEPQSPDGDGRSDAGNVPDFGGRSGSSDGYDDGD